MFIEDGKGSGKQAAITTDNKLEVDSKAGKHYYFVSKDTGQCYIFASGDYITISTTGTETGILHIKNTSQTKNLYIENIRTCGDQIQKWKLYKNSTGGTLISDETAGSKNNTAVYSGNTADATVYKGANAKTVTGGTMLEHWINAVGHSSEIFDGALILGFNDSIELSVELATGGDICCRVIGYFE
jgi:hypothetical protein